MKSLQALKQLVKRAVMALPVTRAIYVRRSVYPTRLSDKALRARLLQVGHRIDLNINNGTHVAAQTIGEFEFLLGETKRRQLALDNSVCWALSLYMVAKERLETGYLVGVKSQPPAADLRQQEGPIVSAIQQRRSVRRWATTPVDLGLVERAIDLAKWAPSSCNRQLWKVLLITKQEDKEFLVPYFSNKFWHSAPVLAVVLMEASIYSGHERHYAYLDAGAFIQNFLLMLHLHGLGACWIGFARWDTLDNIHTDHDVYERFYSRFGLEKGVVPVSMVALGWPAEQPRTPPREDLSNILIKGFTE